MFVGQPSFCDETSDYKSEVLRAISSMDDIRIKNDNVLLKGDKIEKKNTLQNNCFAADPQNPLYLHSPPYLYNRIALGIAECVLLRNKCVGTIGIAKILRHLN
jgi:hypothetical protein